MLDIKYDLEFNINKIKTHGHRGCALCEIIRDDCACGKGRGKHMVCQGLEGIARYMTYAIFK